MFHSNKFDDLKSSLLNYDVKWRDIFNEQEIIIEYNCSMKKSKDVISLFEFRNSRNTDDVKIEKVNSILKSISLNNQEFIIIHHLIMTKNRDAIIYTDLVCDKILGVLSIGL